MHEILSDLTRFRNTRCRPFGRTTPAENRRRPNSQRSAPSQEIGFAFQTTPHLGAQLTTDLD